MVVVGKILKWLALAAVAWIVWILISYTVMNTIVTMMFEWEMKYEGAKMQKNEWVEFDLDRVDGETPASLFGGLQLGQSILKYRLELMYPYDGKVGFVGGSDRVKQENIWSDKNPPFGSEGKRIPYEWVMKNEQAYLFRTINDGKSFTRQALGHGIINDLKKNGESYFINIHEADTYKDHTLRSDDYGKSWKKLGDFRIEAMFDKERFIYVVTKSISRAERKHSYFYTKDGGKTAKLLDKKLLTYKKKSLSNSYIIYKGNLVFLIERSLIFVNIDTLDEKIKSLKIPENLLLKRLEKDNEEEELYIVVENSNAKSVDNFKQESIWYPLSNELVVFDKLPEYILFMNVRGNYIGGLLRYRGLLAHIWTMDKGREWKFEVLPHYFWESSFTGYGHGRIYMDAFVQSKKGVKKGSYLIIGKIKR